MTDSKQGIIPNFVGGLGNQMFQISAGYIISKVQNCPFYIPYYTNTNNPHNKEIYTQTIFKYLGTILPFAFDSKELYDYHCKNNYTYHQNYTFHTPYKKWSPFEILPATKLTSYYQYYPAISPFEYELRYLFLKGLEPTLKNIETLVHNSETSAFLHIRRGDYLKYSDTFYNITLDYYKRAIDTLLKENSFIEKIYVMSDEPQWVEEQEMFKEPLFTLIKNNSELETLAIMSLCKGGAICANSTFSWWGAFLGAFSERTPVIVPKKWIKNNSNEPLDIFPPDWIQLD